MTAEEIAHRLGAKRTGNGWAAKCPAHDDRQASLSIAEGRNGQALLKCFAGCSFDEIRAAAGMNGTGPHRDAKPHHEKPKAGRTFPTLDEAAAACLASVKKQSGRTDWNETRRDKYTGTDGNAVAVVLRFDCPEGKTFRPVRRVADGWQFGDPPGTWPLFRLPAILQDGGLVLITEGEKAATAGAAIGLNATTTAHGAQSPGKTDWAPLQGRRVAILPDNDKAGADYAEAVARLALDAGAAEIRIVALPGLPAKGDLFEWIEERAAQDAEETRRELLALVDAAEVWTPPEASETEPAPDASLDPIAAARAGTPYPRTDLGNAERLAKWHGETMRWDVSRKCWRVWDGTRWATDSALQVQALAADTARRIRNEAAEAPTANEGQDLGRELFQHALRSESRDRLSAMGEVCKGIPGIAVAADSLDSDPWLLNVRNGTVDLRTGELRPHNRADLLTKLAPVDYRPGHTDSRWEGFLRDATGGDSELADFLQIATGYSLTGSTQEERLFIVYGPEAAGKSTFLECLKAALGQYATTIDPAMLAKHKGGGNAGGATPELARLAGVRLAAGSEMEHGAALAEALAKNLTGGESISARHLYAEPFDFTPQFTIWLALNHCPRVSAEDGAIWRRILRIGFEHTVSPERRDPTLKAHLRNPAGGLPAVLAWAVEGCLRWQRTGLRIPAAVQRSTDAYRSESDPLSAFVEDCLRIEPRAWVPWADAWAAYNEHAAELGTGEKYRVSPKRLQERLRQMGATSDRRHDGRGWAGIELKTDWQNPSRDACDGCDAFSETFLYEREARKTFESGVTTDTTDTEARKASKNEVWI